MIINLNAANKENSNNNININNNHNKHTIRNIATKGTKRRSSTAASKRQPITNKKDATGSFDDLFIDDYISVDVSTGNIVFFFFNLLYCETTRIRTSVVQ